MLQIIYLLFAMSLSGTAAFLLYLAATSLLDSYISAGMRYLCPENLHAVFSGSLSNSEASVCLSFFSLLRISISLQAELPCIRRRRLFRPPTGFIFLFWIFLYKSYSASGVRFC